MIVYCPICKWVCFQQCLSDEKKMGGTSKGVCLIIFLLPYTQRHSTLWGAATTDELGSKCKEKKKTQRVGRLKMPSSAEILK